MEVVGDGVAGRVAEAVGVGVGVGVKCAEKRLRVLDRFVLDKKGALLRPQHWPPSRTQVGGWGVGMGYGECWWW